MTRADSCPRERRFAVRGLTLAAQEWGEPGGTRVLALHGWLDNAGSFDLLAPRLAGCHLFAIDAAGHGYSDFRSPDADYNIWKDVGEIIEIADQLGWERFRFIGHSRGAAIGALLAGTFPERVEQLLLIEGGLPLIGPAERAPVALAEALRRSGELAGRTGRLFAERDMAVLERAHGFSKVTPEAADILARRSLREVEGGFRWHADQRLKAPSELRLTADQVRAFIARVTAPVLMIRADESPFARFPEYDEMLPLFRAIEVVTLAGRHHLHLEGAEAAIAARALRFFGL